MLLRHILLTSLIAVGTLCIGEEPTRMWTSAGGKTLSAKMMGFEKGRVVLEGAEKQRIVIGREQMAEGDWDFALQWKKGKTHRDWLAPVHWPERVAHPAAEIVAEDGEDRGLQFLSRNYEFVVDAELSKGMMQSLATTAEATLKWIDALPLRLPERQSERFFARVFASQETYLAGGGRADMAGYYVGGPIGKPGVLLVPAASLGAGKFGGKIGIGVGFDTHVLIHEITHQATGDALPLLPRWLQEGLAEFVSRTPYHEGVFDLSERSLAEALKKRLNQMREIGAGHDAVGAAGEWTRVTVPLEKLMADDAGDWKGLSSLREMHRYYFTAHLLTAWLMRLDEGGQATGVRVAFERVHDAVRFLLTQGQEGRWPVALNPGEKLKAESVRQMVHEEILKGRTWAEVDRLMRQQIQTRWSLSITDERAR